MLSAARNKGIARIGIVLVLALVVFLATFIATLPAENAQAKGSKCRMIKNVIVMISDGCGYNHVEATDYYEAGRKKAQAYDSFPVRAGMSTYEYEKVDGVPTLLGYDPLQAWSDFDYVRSHPPDGGGYTDSASAATAMSTGTKTLNGRIGVDIDGNPLKHVAESAEERGIATGVVTSVQWSHATPAGFVAHNISRNDYAAIAREMIEDSATDVIMGCGNPGYDNDGLPQAPTEYKYVGGEATWDALVAGTAGNGTDADHNGKADDAWKLIQTRAEFQALMNGKAPKRVCGVPQVSSTLQQSRDGDGYADPYVVPLTESVPTLTEMTRGALNVLDNDRDGQVHDLAPGLHCRP